MADDLKRDEGGVPVWLAWPLLLSPAERKALPFGLESVWQWLIQAWARQLGVTDTADVEQWRQRLFILPPLDETERGWHATTRRGWALAVAALSRGWQDLRQSNAALAASSALDQTLARRSLPAPWVNRLLLLLVVMIALGFATTPLGWGQQLWLSALIFLVSIYLRQFVGRLPSIILISFSVLTTLRYLWWRITYSLDVQSELEMVFALILLAAELYAALILFMGFAQTIWPLRRKPLPLPADTASWPSVDVFIPTYDEPLEVVKTAVFAAQSLDWPKDRLQVYLLDDGKRDSFRQFAEDCGIHYLRRPDNAHAKAGNLNYALARSSGEFIAAFDCDHIPVRSFLQLNMGWLVHDPLCALVQTPHHFFSPDPMERNLGTFRRVPNEGALFYGLIQDGNDLWNASFFCGSCAILRRKPLQDIGGIAVETVTEDAHTALKLHRLGYRSVYCGVPQAAGLATENLASHIRQRIRWARGMAQMMNLDNPLSGPGLSAQQRLCYANSILHFLHGLPRIVFVCAPLLYLYFGLHIFSASGIMIAAFVVPHLVQGSLANAQSQSRFRHSFWGQVYESTLAWYIAWPSAAALINPRAGKFNVTSKGGLVERQHFDWQISRPFVLFIALSAVGLVVGLFRLLVWNSYEVGTVLLNFAWAGYNLIVLGAAAGVADEHRQIRRTHRVAVGLPAVLYLPDGRGVQTETSDFSLGGARLQWPDDTPLPPADTPVHLGMRRGATEYCFAASVVAGGPAGGLALRFAAMDAAQERDFLQCTFGRADLWAVDEPLPPKDHPWASFVEILRFGVKGYRRVWWYFSEQLSEQARPLWRKLRAGGEG